MELTKKTLIENHRFTTIERMKLPLHSPGALVKLSPTATIQNVSSSYLSKELIKEE